MGKKKKGNIIQLILIVITLAVIWSHSLLSKNTSGNESGAVLMWLKNTFPFLESLSELFLRKLAHFCEHGLLSFQLGLYLLRNGSISVKKVLASINCSFVVAFLDETIQIFSGRGPAIVDVWIDLFGSVCAMGVILLVYLIGVSKRR